MCWRISTPSMLMSREMNLLVNFAFSQRYPCSISQLHNKCKSIYMFHTHYKVLMKKLHNMFIALKMITRILIQDFARIAKFTLLKGFFWMPINTAALSIEHIYCHKPGYTDKDPICNYTSPQTKQRLHNYCANPNLSTHFWDPPLQQYSFKPKCQSIRPRFMLNSAFVLHL